MSLKVIITGSTGMVGKAVLLECLESEAIDQVLLINRRSVGITHNKVKEILHADFMDFSAIQSELKGYDACFHCMGVSVVGLTEEKYTQLTYAITKHLAETVKEQNPNLIFNYVSGTGTDSTEKGRSMWARVKGKTENTLLNMGFKDAYMFRPGGILPEKGIKSATGWYNAIYVVLRPFFPLLKKMNSMTTTTKLGQAMINSLLYPSSLKLLENPDINQLGTRNSQ